MDIGIKEEAIKSVSQRIAMALMILPYLLSLPNAGQFV